MLSRSNSIAKTKWHYQKLENAKSGKKSGKFFQIIRPPDLIKSLAYINFSKIFCILKLSSNLFNKKYEITIFLEITFNL